MNLFIFCRRVNVPTTGLVLPSLLFLVLLFQSCQSPSETAVSCLFDHTDTREARAHIFQEDILSFTGLSDNIWNGALLRCSQISDTHFNTVHEYSIPTGNDLFGINLDRKNEIKYLHDDLEKLITAANKVHAGKPKSLIYSTVIREINYLSELAVNRKVLLVYSDLFEHSSLVSLYDKESIELLHSDPSTFWDLLQSTIRAPLTSDLDGLHIYFIFQPSNHDESILFRSISDLYQQKLQERGAKVFVVANL